MICLLLVIYTLPLVMNLQEIHGFAFFFYLFEFGSLILEQTAPSRI